MKAETLKAIIRVQDRLISALKNDDKLWIKQLESELTTLKEGEQGEEKKDIVSLDNAGYLSCDVCKCHPSVIIRTSFGTFCQLHAKYV